MSAPPVQNSRISGLDDVFQPNTATLSTILPNLDFQEPLTETQRLMTGGALNTPITPPEPKIEIKDDICLPDSRSDIIEVPDDPESDLDDDREFDLTDHDESARCDESARANESTRANEPALCTGLIEVIKKEVVEIRTTKTYFIKNKQIGQRVKTRYIENSQTVQLSQAELDQKLAKTDQKVAFKTVKVAPVKVPVEAGDLSVKPETPQSSIPPEVENAEGEDESSVAEEVTDDSTDFTELYIKDELMVADSTAGVLTRSSDDLNVGVRCFVKYDQFYYPAVVHELLGQELEIGYCFLT